MCLLVTEILEESAKTQQKIANTHYVTTTSQYKNIAGLDT